MASGAFSTVLHAGGRSASASPLGAVVGGCQCRTASLNQKLSDLSQPSPIGTGGCLRQLGESSGHFSLTWMWSAWPYQGRTLYIQPSLSLSTTRHNSFLIA